MFKFLGFSITLFFIAYSLNVSTLEAEGGPPPNPTIYTGTISVGGEVPADSKFVLEGVRRRCLERCVTAKVGSFTSDAAIVENGIYVLTFGPPDNTFVNSPVTFHFDGLVKADQETIFMISGTIKTESNYSLTFPDLPTPTPIPALTLAPSIDLTPIEPVVVTATPLPLASLQIEKLSEGNIPFVSIDNLHLSISGEVAYNVSDYQDDLEIVAKIGSYFSPAVSVTQYEQDGEIGFAVFDSLEINPGSAKFIGKSIVFYFRDGEGVSTKMHLAKNTSLIFGETLSEIDIELEVGDASLFNNPTATGPLPTDVIIGSAESSIEDPSIELPGSGSTCGRVETLSFVEGSPDMLMMIAPIFLLVAYTGWRKRK